MFGKYPAKPNNTQEDFVLKRGLELLLIGCLTTGTLRAASDPLVGKWKLDPSRSKITDLMRVAEAGANEYNLIFNSGDLETIVADGTDQPALFGTTVSITVLAPDHWKVVRKQDGRTLLMGNWKLSEDGKTLTDNFTSNQPDGSSSTVNYIYLRSAGGSGFPGSWESQDDTVHGSFELQIQPYEGEGLSIVNPGEGSTRMMKFDGKDYPSQGKYAALTDKIKGRVADTQQFELSPDLKTLTITEHPAGQSKPNILVFDRE
jgi:hypothetical protein